MSRKRANRLGHVAWDERPSRPRYNQACVCPLHDLTIVQADEGKFVGLTEVNIEENNIILRMTFSTVDARVSHVMADNCAY